LGKTAQYYNRLEHHNYKWYQDDTIRILWQGENKELEEGEVLPQKDSDVPRFLAKSRSV